MIQFSGVLCQSYSKRQPVKPAAVQLINLTWGSKCTISPCKLTKNLNLMYNTNQKQCYIKSLLIRLKRLFFVLKNSFIYINQKVVMYVLVINLDAFFFWTPLSCQAQCLCVIQICGAQECLLSFKLSNIVY